MFAAVDLGSNSFRMHIASHDGETIKVLKSARDPIRLAAGLDGRGNMTEAAMQAALECLTRFNVVLKSYPIDAVRVVATNTLRIAKNAAAFLPLAEKAIGYPIEIISGEEEGRLIYMGVASTLASSNERRLVLDIGGGSTELILGQGQEIERVESFSIGNVKQSLSFFPGGRIDAASFDAAILSARSYFEDAAPPYYPQYWSTAYGSSGTIRSIADAITKNGLGDGTLSRVSLEALKQRLIQFGHASRIDLLGMKPDRAAVMVGGLAILIGVMQELSFERMIPIEAGLRMGVLWDLQWRATKRDRREQSVRNFIQRFHVDEGRAKRVADVASLLYNQLKPADDTYTRYLYWSGLLHEVGLAVSQSGYHKHAAYLIANADLPGFTTREQRVMSNMILGQKGNLRKVNEALMDIDFAKAILALRLAVMFMHSRIEVNLDALRLRMKSKIELEIRSGWFMHHPTVSFWMEKERECWSEVGIDFTIKINA
jgi:exopolyphosphatase/guanosine-5'-triphosphate,3'-diphosphate pyrophosphatase